MAGSVGLFQRQAVAEGVADAGAQLDVAIVDGIEGDQAHLLYVRLAVLGQIGLVAYDVDNLADQIASGFRLVDFLLDAAFERHGEVGEHRGVDMSRLDDVQSGLGHLVGLLAAADDAHVVGGRQGLGSGERHRELAGAG